MGLSLKLSMFHGTLPSEVYRQYEAFYARIGRPLMESGEPGYENDVHDVNGGWTIVSHGIGWDWDERREVQRHVAAALGCVSLFAFVHDGDYWGYELGRDGVVLDQFVQDPDPGDGTNWFPGRSMAGDPAIFAAQFPWLPAADVAPYLVQIVRLPSTHGRDASFEDYTAWRNKLDRKARLGDEFTRLDECAILDFLRLLRVHVFMAPREGDPYEGRYVTFGTPIYRSFWTRP